MNKRVMASSPEWLQKVLRDPAQGEWCVNREETNVWVNANSETLGVLLEKDGAMLEDACWLQPANDAWHINLAELDTVVKGVNLVLEWQAKRLHLHTDSLCVYYWVSNVPTRKARIHIKAACEMLIRQKLDTLRSLVSEYDLTVSVILVALYCNFADQLTQVPNK